MAKQIHDNIIRSMQAADTLYYRLVLLVGDTGSGKTGVLRDIAEKFGTEVINVNLGLSAEMLELTERQRYLRLPELLRHMADKAHPPLILDNLEILFDTNLKQDPLRLLQGISRNCSVVASWNGAVVDGRLTYAEVSHPEYRNYEIIDTLIVSMDGKETSIL